MVSTCIIVNITVFEWRLNNKWVELAISCTLESSLSVETRTVRRFWGHQISSRFKETTYMYNFLDLAVEWWSKYVVNEAFHRDGCTICIYIPAFTEKYINTFYAFSFKVGHTFCLSIYGMSFSQNPHHKEPWGLENNHRIYRNKLVLVK